jgi:hypothetical protein
VSYNWQLHSRQILYHNVFSTPQHRICLKSREGRICSNKIVTPATCVHERGCGHQLVPSHNCHTVMKMFVTAFSEELSSVLTRRSMVMTEEEHHVSLFGHSEGGLQVEEVSDVYTCVASFKVMECFYVSYVCRYTNAPSCQYVRLCTFCW